MMKLFFKCALGWARRLLLTGFDKIEWSDSQENFFEKVVVCDVKLE